MCLRGLRLNECTSVSGGMTTTHTDHARMNNNCEGFVAARNTKGNKRRGKVLVKSTGSKITETGETSMKRRHIFNKNPKDYFWLVSYPEPRKK